MSETGSLTPARARADLATSTPRIFATLGMSRKYRRGADMCQEGRAASDLIYVQSGYAMLNQVDAEGRRIFAGMILPGDILTSGSRDSWEAKTLTEMVVRIVPRSVLERSFAADTANMYAYMRSLEDQLRRSCELTVINHRHRVIAQIAGFVRWIEPYLRRRSEHEPAIVVDFPFQVSDMAIIFGATPESVSRGFKALSKTGAIAYASDGGSKELWILDERQLHAIADCEEEPASAG